MEFTSQSLKRHSLTEQPRLSSFAVLLLSGGWCYAASHHARWIALGYGRSSAKRLQIRDGHLSDAPSDEALLNGSRSHLPRHPRRHSLAALVFFIVLRLEIFHRVNYQPRCASPGIESFLCILLICWEVLSNRQRWGVPPSEDADNPWRSVFDDLHDWFTGPRVTMVLVLTSALVFSTGAYLAASQIAESTFACFSPVDSRPLTLALQILGLSLDAAIIVLLWRILAWTRTARLRLRVLASAFVFSSLASAGLWLGSAIFGGFRRSHAAFGSLHGLDFLIDSAALATFVSSAAFYMCETSPIAPVSVLTFLAGTWYAGLNVVGLGDWMHLSRVDALLPVWFLAFGTVLFTFTHDIRSVIFVPRPLLTFLFMALLCVATIVTFTTQMPTFDDRHPISELLYQAQTKHNRWLLKAGTSQSLPVAVDVYQERHAGRAPPPNFDEWYRYATESLIIDDFEQMDQDLAPFWELAPADIRSRADAMAANSDVAVIRVQNGKVTKRHSGEDAESADLEELAEMIKLFSTHLPDMVLPINLGPAPRVLPSWSDAELQSRADFSSLTNGFSKIWPQASVSSLGSLGTRSGQDDPKPRNGGPTRASDLRQMQIEACPPTSRARTSPDWNIGQFCSECVNGHSWGQGVLMTDFYRSLDVCGQPDLKHLHGFSLTDRQSMPVRQLVPLFGASKTNEFRDILIPLPRSRLEKPDMPWQFSRRYDNLFWRGSVGNNEVNGQALRGSHKFRLLHLLNRPDKHDEVPMVLPTPGENGHFRIEMVPAAEANRALPMSIGMIDYSACSGAHCELVKHAFGTEADTEEALEYRYVLLTDEDDGPPSEMLRTLRSGSVPFISTIFRTWYTERLVPWLHFVPVDTRYQSLHTTFAYFTGTENRPKLNGRDTALRGRHKDATWVSRRGQKWAEQVLRKKDMEIYLFRLLLEWGRLIDDRRGEIGYRRGQDGLQNHEWTRRQ
ncbi:glycosyltransferase family 90 protein [Ophiocordyceps sinensis CO18]|nr:glycosyltransferase family 90 protein [Ophiocordyceps sinensis CO18]